MACVAAVLLDEVAEQPPQVGVVARVVVRRAIVWSSPLGQGRRQPRAGAGDGTVPHGIQLARGVVGGGSELPVGAHPPSRTATPTARRTVRRSASW